MRASLHDVSKMHAKVFGAHVETTCAEQEAAAVRSRVGSDCAEQHPELVEEYAALCRRAVEVAALEARIVLREAVIAPLLSRVGVQATVPAVPPATWTLTD